MTLRQIFEALLEKNFGILLDLPPTEALAFVLLVIGAVIVIAYAAIVFAIFLSSK